MAASQRKGARGRLITLCGLPTAPELEQGRSRATASGERTGKDGEWEEPWHISEHIRAGAEGGVICANKRARSTGKQEADCDSIPTLQPGQ